MRLKGLAYIITGSMLWGLSGPMMEWIFARVDLSLSFVIAIRLILSGIILLCLLVMMKQNIFVFIKNPAVVFQIGLFSIVGVLGLQYMFLAALEASNSIMATLFQFSAPIIIVIYSSFIHKQLPPRYQVFGIIGTLFGLFLLLTNGSFSQLVVSIEAIGFGIGLGITYVFYTLYPSKLMKDWGLLVVLGWAMLFGGFVIAIVGQIWASDEWSMLGELDISLMLAASIVCSTLAYTFFLNSLKYISAVEASILSSIEPLTVMLVAVIWFGTVLETLQLIGAIVMLLFVTWLSIGDQRRVTKRKI